MGPITSILLDADGVVQMPVPDWRSQLMAAAGDCGAQDGFLGDIFSAEERCVTGEMDFATALQGIVSKWQCDADVDRILELWTLIEPNPEVFHIIDELRKSGRRVYLATNQHRHRARYMTRELGYHERFDDCFYSCDLGHAKPSRAYFINLIERLTLKGSESLFIDDKDTNVAVARQVGLHAEQFHVMEGVDELRRTLRRYNIKLA